MSFLAGGTLCVLRLNKKRSSLLLHVNFCSIPGKSDDGDKMVPAIKKNFAELETGLVHLQQNIDIPEINLVIHPQILAVSFLIK